MTETFGLLKKLTTSRAPKKVLIREEAKFLVTKNVNSISLTRWEEERIEKTDVTTGDDFEKPTKTKMEMPVKEAEKEDEAENKPNRKAEKEETTKAPSSQPVEFYLKHRISEKLIEGLMGIAEDVLAEVAEHVYPMDFVILDIKEDEKRPFILGIPMAKAIEREVKNDIEPIAPTITVNRLVLEWEGRIKLYLEMEMEFGQWKSKNFKGKHPALVKIEGGMDDEGEFT
nr:hypothetical protein [Tanacetum cinerariifolium]